MRSGSISRDTRHRCAAFPPIIVPPPKIGKDSEVNIRGRKVLFFVAMARNIALRHLCQHGELGYTGGMTSSGLPVGIEFDALKGQDRELLALGLSLKKARLGLLRLPKCSNRRRTFATSSDKLVSTGLCRMRGSYTETWQVCRSHLTSSWRTTVSSFQFGKFDRASNLWHP